MSNLQNLSKLWYHRKVTSRKTVNKCKQLLGKMKNSSETEMMWMVIIPIHNFSGSNFFLIYHSFCSEIENWPKRDKMQTDIAIIFVVFHPSVWGLECMFLSPLSKSERKNYVWLLFLEHIRSTKLNIELVFSSIYFSNPWLGLTLTCLTLGPPPIATLENNLMFYYLVHLCDVYIFFNFVQK